MFVFLVGDLLRLSFVDCMCGLIGFWLRGFASVLALHLFGLAVGVCFVFSGFLFGFVM